MIIRHTDLRKRIIYFGVDQSQNAIRYCRATLPQNYKLLCQDVLTGGLPEDSFDVIMINEVLEHIPYYDQIISAAIAKKPKILIITTFAVLPDLKRDRILWRPDKDCYMNSYSFQKFFLYLRSNVKCPILIHDYGTIKFNRFWFPRKAQIMWYLRLENEES
jgi:hypothetical protein